MFDAYLDGLSFVGWLCKWHDSITKEVCSICLKIIELSSKVWSVLTDHAKGKNHIDAVKKKEKFFKPNSSQMYAVVKNRLNLTKIAN